MGSYVEWGPFGALGWKAELNHDEVTRIKNGEEVGQFLPNAPSHVHDEIGNLKLALYAADELGGHTGVVIHHTPIGTTVLPQSGGSSPNPTQPTNPTTPPPVVPPPCRSEGGCRRI